jgi:hypothetical protein
MNLYTQNYINCTVSDMYKSAIESYLVVVVVACCWRWSVIPASSEAIALQ